MELLGWEEPIGGYPHHAWVAVRLSVAAALAELDHWPAKKRTSEEVLSSVGEHLDFQFRELEFLTLSEEQAAHAILETMRKQTRSYPSSGSS